MPCRVRSILLTLFCLSQLAASNAQSVSSDYSITNYNSDNALPQNSINAMAFDRNGFLWLATEMGVVRFDGRNFREYNSRNSPALQSDRCSLLTRENTSGMVLIEPQFSSHWYLEVTPGYQLKEDSVLVTRTHHSHLQIGGVFSYANLYKKWASRDTGVFARLFNGFDLNRDLFGINATQGYVRQDQNYYFLDEKTGGISLLPGVTGHASKLLFAIGEVFVCIDKENHLYVYKNGLPQKITGSDRLMKLLGEADITGPYPQQAALQAKWDDHHTFLIHKGDILLLHLTNGLLDFDTLAANTPIRNINCLIYDQQYKIIYVGTATSGLYIIKKREFQRSFFSSDNYVVNSLYAQVELSDGNILTSSGILNRQSKINIPTPNVYDRPAFLRSSDGYIWYSSYGWLKRTDTGLNHSENILNLGDISLVGIWISSIIETANKDILFCTQRGKLYRIREKTATLLLDAGALLKNIDMNVILPVSSNELWIGTDAGIYSYDLLRGKFCLMPGLEKANVRALHKVRDGSIWIGTYGQGFYTYDKGRFLKMPMDPAGNLATVHCFMEDTQGYFWLPTNKGLFKVAKSQLDSFASGDKHEVFYYYFDKSSGFATNEFNGGCNPCGIVTRDGHFSLPSLDGLIQFVPDSITVILPDHPIFIDRLVLDNKRLSCDYFEQAQDAGPLVFFIASPYYGNPANLHLEYSIPELDNRWHPVSADGKLTLTGLGHGRYTLTVRKQEGYSRYSYKTARWTILPYWYETIWFRILAALVIISILPVIFYVRYTRQVRRSKQLEQKVAERTEALSENNRVKEKMIAIILHDLRSPLRFLHMLATHIYESHQKVAVSEREEMLRKFRNATRDVYEFAQDFVVWTNAQKEGFVVRREKIVLRDIVSEIISLYEPGADIRNNIILNLVPETFTLVSDSHILKLLIRNLTDNATKYTSDGEIKIQAIADDSALSITITDTGRSMEKKLVNEILSNTYQADNETQGFGYKLILELLTKLGGRLIIDTPGDTGNRITLLFPVENS